MDMWIYVNGHLVGTACGCEAVGEAFIKAQQLAEALGVDCSMVSTETGEVLAMWEP